MRKIIYTLLLFLTIYSYGQINRPDKRGYSTFIEIIDAIYEHNENIKTYEILDYKFSDGVMFYVIILTNQKDDFIDIVYARTKYGKYELIKNKGLYIYNKRKLLSITKKSNDHYILLFSNDSDIVIKFDTTTVTGSKCRLYSKDTYDVTYTYHDINYDKL